jgi:hypothetical protein
VLVIFDEAQGIQDEIWDASNGLMTSDGCRHLAIGNPIRRGNRFHDACEKPDLWEVMRIRASDTPNIIAGKTIYPGLISQEYCDDIKKQFGENSAYYKARIMAEFPDSDSEALFRWEWIDRAHKTFFTQSTNGSLVIDERIGPASAFIGLDVARYGDDDTAWSIIEVRQPRLTPRARLAITTKKHDLMDTCGRTVDIVETLKREGFTNVTLAVDETGVGGGVVDRLKELSAEGTLRADVMGVNFGASARDPGRYPNARTEIWFELRDALRDGALSLPMGGYDSDLRDVRSDRFDSRSRVRLQSKEEIKVEIGRSPDKGDALALAIHALKSFGIPDAFTAPISRCVSFVG